MISYCLNFFLFWIFFWLLWNTKYFSLIFKLEQEENTSNCILMNVFLINSCVLISLSYIYFKEAVQCV